MPKAKLSTKEKVRVAMFKYPNEFSTGFNGQLFCKLCSNEVNCQKQFNIDAHRKTAKHIKLIEPAAKQPRLCSENNPQ